jgi:PAS domain S-box-containing protein
MKDKDKIKEQLIDELKKLRKLVPASGPIEADHNWTERRTRDFLETLIEGSMDGIIITDGKGIITSVNNAIQRMTAFTKEELIGEHASVLSTKDKNIRKMVLEKTRELFEKDFCSYESRFITKDGNLIDVESSSSLIKNDEGDIIAGISTVRDITEKKKAGEELKKHRDNLDAINKKLKKEINERKKAEKEIRESKEFLEDIFKTTADGIMVSDNSGYVTRVNKAIEKMLGFREDELIGKHTMELAPQDKEHMKTGDDMTEQLSDKGFVENLEAEWYRKDGSLCPIEFNVTFLRDQKGNPNGAVAVIRDITERKRVEEERIRLSSAVEQASETVVIMGLDGKIQYMNPAMENILGYTREEAIGVNPFYSERGIYDKQFYKEIWETISKGNLWKGYITYKKKDGNVCEFEITISPVRDKSGNIINFVSIGRDITNELMLERQLRQSQKMEAIGTLAGGIAHDFNNILAAIIGFAEMSLNRLPEDTRSQHDLKQVINAAYRGESLVNQILSFSHQRELEKKPIQLEFIIKEALKFLRATLPKTIKIRQKIKTNLDMVIADPTQIHQLLINLCTNAAQAMREKGGVLEISLADVYISENQISDLSAGPFIELKVSDTGIGMDASVMEQIFNPFFTTKKLGEGTGMGLSVVHGIVKSHGGAITVDSTLGKGSTFHVFFPKIEREVREEPCEVELVPTGEGSILFVDDEKVLKDIGERILKSLGYKVVATTSSIEAIEIFRKEPDKFDMVVTDQTMPDMTGYDLAKELMGIRPDIPVILCTGFSETVSPEKAKDLGIKEFLMKPINRRKIAETIRRVMDNVC